MKLLNRIEFEIMGYSQEKIKQIDEDMKLKNSKSFVDKISDALTPKLLIMILLVSFIPLSTVQIFLSYKHENILNFIYLFLLILCLLDILMFCLNKRKLAYIIFALFFSLNFLFLA